jgi:hypothetical protein
MTGLFIRDALPTRLALTGAAADIKPAERTLAPRTHGPPTMPGPSPLTPPTAHCVLIEDIAGRRRREGIDDVDLRDGIRGLAVGDLVRLTLRAEQSQTGETVVVRVTEIGAGGFRGALARKPASKTLAALGVGYTFGFTADHIHSLATGRAGCGHDGRSS